MYMCACACVCVCAQAVVGVCNVCLACACDLNSLHSRTCSHCYCQFSLEVSQRVSSLYLNLIQYAKLCCYISH